jgi:hypothetical protein
VKPTMSRVGRLAVLMTAFVCAGLLVTGCSVSVGPTLEFVVDEPLGGASVTDVKLGMGAGTLSVRPGAPGLASGVIRYNVKGWEPTLKRTDSSLTIEQGSPKGLSGLGGDVVNEWDLQFGEAPMRLEVNAGAYEGSYELGGLTLAALTIKDGAAKSEVAFSAPNPGQMMKLEYDTGASTVSFTGLADANFKTMEFNGGAGTYTFDFTGTLRSDGTVRIKAGVGTVRLVVPAGTAVGITVDGTLTDVSLEGTWVTDEKVYQTEAAADRQAKRLDIEVQMSVGRLELVVQ